MASYVEVNEILAQQYGWPAGVSASPAQVDEALAAGMTVEAAAGMLEAYCRNAANGAEVPGAIEAYGPDGVYEACRYSLFVEDGHFWGLNTSLALGLQTEALVVPDVPPAKTVSEWWTNQSNGYSRLGYRLYDPNDALSVADFDARFEAANLVPVEWATETDPMIYRLAVRERYIKVNQTGFHSLYSASTPASVNDVRGLTAQKWLDNLRALDAGYGRDAQHPLPWTPTKPASKVPA